MKYQIMGTTMPAVEIQFDRPGESVYTQSGGMTWMTDGVQMSTNAKGGLMKGLGRRFAGESMFMATYTAEHAGSPGCWSHRWYDLPERSISLCRRDREPECNLQ